MSSMRNPFRRAKAENESGVIHIQVKWGAHKFNIPIENPDVTPLSQLIGTLSHHTGIAPDQMKLIYKGAQMRDQSLTLSAYGVTDGSLITVVGSNEPIPSAPSATPTPPPQVAVKKKNKQPETDNEQVLTDWIHNYVAGVVDPLEAAVHTFVSQASPKAKNRPKHIPAFDVLQKEHARLSELLLRGLIDLDGVEIPSAWTNARAERKAGVKRVQTDINKIDEAWGDRKLLGQ